MKIRGEWMEYAFCDTRTACFWSDERRTLVEFDLLESGTVVSRHRAPITVDQELDPPGIYQAPPRPSERRRFNRPNRAGDQSLARAIHRPDWREVAAAAGDELIKGIAPHLPEMLEQLTEEAGMRHYPNGDYAEVETLRENSDG